MLFYHYALTVEASLPNEASEGEKVSVCQHGRPSLRSIRMSEHASPKLIDSGRIAFETSKSVPTVTKLTAGGIAS